MKKRSISLKDSGYDVLTGKAKREIPSEGPLVGMIHHRCYRNKATSRYILTGKHGIEVIDLKKGWDSNNSWIRGTCQYGIMPANGFILAPPDACGCSISVKQQGFNAVGPKRAVSKVDIKQTDRLEKGPEFEKKSGKESSKDDWPTYRYDRSRSQYIPIKLPTSLKKKWQISVGGKLTQPIISDGKVYVVSVDKHTLYTFNINTGKELWSYTAGGRVDSSPTIYKGNVLFGCVDGYVYCLNSVNGKLVWRFLAAPEQRLIGSYEQLESVWPVHGSVLVQNDVLYCTAGRSTYLDSGIYLYRLDPKTGRALSVTLVTSLDPKTGKQIEEEKRGSFNSEGTLNDILSGDGEAVFLKHFVFNSQGKRINEKRFHLLASTGFLDAEYFVRSFWQYGTDYFYGYGGWAAAGNMVPSGRVLCFNDKNVYGYGRKQYAGGKAGHRANKYHLFSDLKKVERIDDKIAKKEEEANARRKKAGKKVKAKRIRIPSYEKINNWSVNIPIVVKAMILSIDNLITCGVPNPGQEKDDILEFENQEEAVAAQEGKMGSVIQVYSIEDGSQISELKLDALPIYDGMSAARGKVFMALKNGELLCLDKK